MAEVNMVELSAMALVRVSRSTISRIKDWRAGASKALQMPSRKAMIRTCHHCTSPLKVSAARTKARIIMAA